MAQQGITPDQFKADVKLQARDTVKQDLALDAWARHFDMQVSEEDINQEFANSGAADPKKLQAEWRQNGQLYLVKNGVARTKAALDVMEKAIVSELAPGKPEEKKPAAKKAATKKATAKKADSKAETAEKKPAAKKSAAKKEKADEAASAE